MGSIKAPMLVEDLGMGMRILKRFDIQEDGKSAFLKRLSVAITAPTNRSASWNWNNIEIYKFKFNIQSFPINKNHAVVLPIRNINLWPGPWRKMVIPHRWLGKSSTTIGPITGMYEYLKE